MTTKLYTVAQAAVALGVSPGRVRQLIRLRGVGAKHGRDYALTAADLRALKPKSVGRPKNTPAFRLK